MTTQERYDHSEKLLPRVSVSITTFPPRCVRTTTHAAILDSRPGRAWPGSAECGTCFPLVCPVVQAGHY